MKRLLYLNFLSQCVVDLVVEILVFYFDACVPNTNRVNL